MKDTLQVRVRFGAFELDLKAGELYLAPPNGDRPQNRIVLSQQPFRLLLMLVEREGAMVTREEIQKKFWPNDTIVEFDHSINVAIGKLRKALGDSADSPQYIVTVASRGYRLMVPVERISVADDSPGIAVAQGAGDVGAAVRLQPIRAVLIGQTVSHYRVLDIIGGGGMGVVYRAEDLKLGRRVAMKFLPEEMATDAPALQRFEREARTASSLNHPNICTIYEFGEHQGHPFLVMELLQGETLRDRLAAAGAKALPFEELLDVALQITDGLQAAHEQGIVHRDIKPANIFLTNKGVCKILDFGLAKLLVQPSPMPVNGRGLGLQPVQGQAAENEPEREPWPEESPMHRPEVRRVPQFVTTMELGLSRTGSAMGTAAYMSPEQVRGEKLDARSDLFSLGLVLYEMATGRRAFTGETVELVHDAIVHQPQVPIRDLNSTLPPQLEQIVQKALEKSRARRYQSAMEMHIELEEVRSAKPTRTRQFRIGAAVVALLAVLAVGGVLYWRSRTSHKLTEKDTIVLADFANSTGDAIFDGTLKTALSVSLKQSPLLNVLSDDDVAKTLQLMTRPPDTRLTPEMARELCQRAGSKAYIAGAIGTLGAKYVLELKAVNCASGDSLAEQQVTAESKENVLNVLGEAASKLRRELGESLASVQKLDVPLEQATTSSLEALKEFTLGENAPTLAENLRHFERAIELDPNFAGAIHEAGIMYEGTGQPGRAKEYYARAFQLRERTSERERLAFTTDYYEVVTGQLDKAVQTYQELITTYPIRSEFLKNNLGVVYCKQGQYEKAAGILRQIVRDHPKEEVTFQSNLVLVSLSLQRFDEAHQVVPEMKALRMDFYARRALYALAFVEGDSKAMAEQLQWFAGQPEENIGFLLASNTDAYSGHLGRARELTRQAVDSTIRADSKESGALGQAAAAQIEAAYGNSTAARQSAAEALKLYPASGNVEVVAALALAMAGDAAWAEALAQDLNKRSPLDTQLQSLWLPAIRAQLALNRKDAAAAITALQPAVPPIEYGSTLLLNNVYCLQPTYIRGEAYLAAGQGKEAAAEFQKILDHSGITWNCWTGALAHLGKARADALQARNFQGMDADAAHARAFAAYKDFLTLWKDADPGIPIYIQAKAEYAKLQ